MSEFAQEWPPVWFHHISSAFALSKQAEPERRLQDFRATLWAETLRLASFCRKTYKLLINQEKPIIQDQTSDKLERRSGCGFPARRRSGESNCSLPSRSVLVGKLRVAGQRAEPPDWELNRKFSEGSDSGLSR